MDGKQANKQTDRQTAERLKLETVASIELARHTHKHMYKDRLISKQTIHTD